MNLLCQLVNTNVKRLEELFMKNFSWVNIPSPDWTSFLPTHKNLSASVIIHNFYVVSISLSSKQAAVLLF